MIKTFPKPYRIGENCTRWKLSELLACEAIQSGDSPQPINPESERWLSAKQVAARYHVGINTVWRWARESQASKGSLSIH